MIVFQPNYANGRLGLTGPEPWAAWLIFKASGR